MALTPTQKKNFREAISTYCAKAEHNQAAWHYSQQRPFHFIQDPNASRVVADCSGYVAIVFHAAMVSTHTFVEDPLGYHWSGWGYTGSELQWLVAHGKKVTERNGFLVGDIAINGHSASTTDHTFLCKKAGTATASLWSSNGNENAPQQVSLHYHPVPLVGVYRHPALL